MKIETRCFQAGLPGERRLLLLLPENNEESVLIDEFLGKKVPVEVAGFVDVSDGYGEHYIRLEKAGTKYVRDGNFK